MHKKFIALGVLTMSLAASTCLAQVVEKMEIYEGQRIKYPQVVGEDSQVAAKINQYIVKKVLARTHKFIDKYGDQGATAWMTTEVVQDSGDYLSLRIDNGTCFKNAIHPNNYAHGLVFSKKTGKRLPLSYFVDMPKVKYMENYVRCHVFKMLGYEDEELPLDEDMHVTYVSKEYTLDNNDNLDLIYQQYELGPYAMGNPRIRLDKQYVDLNGSVLPKG